jgi:hypothetical protein
MSLKEYIDKYLLYKLEFDNSYTYEKAENEIIKKLYEKNEKKILEFNKNIE